MVQAVPFFNFTKGCFKPANGFYNFTNGICNFTNGFCNFAKGCYKIANGFCSFANRCCINDEGLYTNDRGLYNFTGAYCNLAEDLYKFAHATLLFAIISSETKGTYLFVLGAVSAKHRFDVHFRGNGHINDAGGFTIKQIVPGDAEVA